jgi:citrate lyase beta subunit
MVLRSILFLPADKIERLPKALGSGADKVILDLEDGLADDKKVEGRSNFADLANRNFDGNSDKFLLRINALDTQEYQEDIKMLKSLKFLPYSIAIPKIESPEECKIFLNDIQKNILILPQVETPKGIANIETWECSGIEFSGIGFGSADYCASTGGDMGKASLAYGRGKIINAAALYNTIALDGVWLDFKDSDGCRAETEYVKSMGFKGRFAIHPDQIKPIHDAYKPKKHELDWARGVLEEAKTAGTGAFKFQGKMVDAPVLAVARLIISREG